MVRAGRILLRDLPAIALSILRGAVGFLPLSSSPDSHRVGNKSRERRFAATVRLAGGRGAEALG